jgi:superfamily II DNA or RNA helicase
MGFSSRLRGSFYSGVRDRGAVYARTGKVRILDETPDQLVAQVRGGARYEVVLDWRRDSLAVACTCPYFEEVGPCKHIWAVALETDRKGLLGAIPATGRVRIETDASLVGVPDDVEEKEIPGPAPEPSRPAARSRTDDLDHVLRRRTSRSGGGGARRTAWRAGLAAIDEALPRPGTVPSAARSELFYAIDRDATIDGGSLVLRIGRLRKQRDGTRSGPEPWSITRSQAAAVPELADRQILALLLGGTDPGRGFFSAGMYHDPPRSTFAVDAAVLDLLLPALCRTGRLCFLAGDILDMAPHAWDDGPPWGFRLRVRETEQPRGWVLEGYLEREGRVLELSAPDLLLEAGLLFAEKRVARLDCHGAFRWISYLRSEGSIRAPASEGDSFTAALHELRALPPTDWPEPLRWQERIVAPRPRLGLEPGKPSRGAPALVEGRLSFLYEDAAVDEGDPRPRIGVAARREVLVRDVAREGAAREELLALGFRSQVNGHAPPGRPPGGRLRIAPRRLPRAVRELVGAGWLVEADGKLYRRPGGIQMEVSSGIDWFDLEGEIDFEGQAASLPALLAALRSGEGTVLLDDGTLGVIPEEWLAKYGFILGSGKVEKEKIRFRRTQLGLLDFLLAEEPEAAWDAAFERARAELRSFERLEPLDPRGEFRGALRPYQRDGLGWLEFLRRFGFGGCLADDMGLGKTVQVLALLESRRQDEGRKKTGPSLVVVPKSLVFNWKSEAARFAPRLEVLDHTGIERSRDADHLRRFDLVVTTYGTLRRDAAFLKDVQFDYVILDESQAVKNSRTQAAKAVRVLRGNHRLALSGTPVENHLGELWSLFEFLNPGMLGSSPVFDGLARAGAGDGDGLLPLKRALRPFILRRTKDQVLDDLPPKLEQTIHCDLEPAERKHYDEIRAYYRASLLGKIESAGLQRSKIQVLEALLRLRQAACHPGLVDRRRTGEPSAKLELLLDRLEEVSKEGHKALVFSQFTSFLAIVKDRLDRLGLAHEYLDGRTRDRAARVARFQTDPACKLFLVSLKAGGLGLNLTAAEYVFLLDPWWNPAVESQAIDRAHRIGQTRRVFAYRLVARDTVEEKVIELQERKRALADAIISAENSLIRDLTREDLEVLLS